MTSSRVTLTKRTLNYHVQDAAEAYQAQLREPPRASSSSNIPPAAATRNSRAFDALVRYTDVHGRNGFVAFEIKYSESMREACRN